MYRTIIAALMATFLAFLPVAATAQTPDFEAIYVRAVMGDEKAQFVLGLMYSVGEGVEENDQEAIKWYRLAAEQGYADAQNNLGVMYAIGQGVTKNYVEAYKWAILAQAQDSENKKLVDLLEKEMTPEQIAEGQARAAAFVPKVTQQD